MSLALYRAELRARACFPFIMLFSTKFKRFLHFQYTDAFQPFRLRLSRVNRKFKLFIEGV